MSQKDLQRLEDALRTRSWHLRQKKIQQPAEVTATTSDATGSTAAEGNNNTKVAKKQQQQQQKPLSKNQQFRNLPIDPEIMKHIKEIGAGRLTLAEKREKREKEKRERLMRQQMDRIRKLSAGARDNEEDQGQKQQQLSNPNGGDLKDDLDEDLQSENARYLGLTRKQMMTMVFQNKFKCIAMVEDPDQFPPPSTSCPEMAFIGRSNVGKSSLLNALTNKFIIKTSDKPGETQSINFYRLGKQLMYLVDLPGYGFAFANEEKIKKWNDLMKGYLKDRTSLKRIFVLLDARHGIKSNDREMIDFLESNSVKFQIIMTKTDLVEPKDLARRMYLVKQEIQKLKFASTDVLLVSSKTKAGIERLKDDLATVANVTEIKERIEQKKSQRRVFFL
eukprot:GEZU01015929.1.p1 GENE.GEZU01015929.1~~GEZU01015929.1.p1  ORF type:complete len:401 (-),score=150.81 GEZU01015929.1:176-1345(-)